MESADKSSSTLNNNHRDNLERVIKTSSELLPTPSNIKRKYKGQYSIGEEIANSITHGIGALLSIAGLVLLIVFALRSGESLKLASGIIFGVSLILEYLASTMYHAIQHPKAKAVLRVIDHSSIYLLIAGSYTPFLFIPLRDHGGIPLMFIIWGVALIGIVVEAFWREKPKWINVVIYVAMGWFIIFKLPTLISVIPSGCLALLVIGGLCYTFGCIFYLMKRVKFMHAIWHLFVLGGSICQFLAVLLYLM